MSRTCSNCGAATALEARFCRHCGIPLKSAMLADSEPVSPLAQTVPLSSEGLTTSNLSTDETGRPAPETRRVRQAEMEQLLSRSRFEVGKDGKGDDGGSTASDDSAYAAPQTGELNKGASKQHVAASLPSAQARGRAANDKSPRRSWLLLASLVLLATLSGALVAYYLLRQRANESAGEKPVASNSNQAAEQTPLETASAANQNAAGGDAAERMNAPPEEKPAPSVKPSVEAQAAREERARLERERKAETPAPLVSPTPAPSPAAAAQASPTPTPSPAANATNGTQPQPQGTSDAFYFQAVNLVNGREPRTLKRAELLRAIQLFQNVTSGAHAAEAARQASRLGKELDRQNKQSQR